MQLLLNATNDKLIEPDGQEKPSFGGCTEDGIGCSNGSSLSDAILGIISKSCRCAQSYHLWIRSEFQPHGLFSHLCLRCTM